MAAIGLDENNFSPSLAGDCITCALAFISNTSLNFKDSKETTLKQRLEFFKELTESAVFTIVPASPSDIGHLGIWKARNLAAYAAIQCTASKLKTMDITADEIITDWSFHTVDLGPIPKRCIKNAGHYVPEVAAASIIGKLYIDALFAGYDLYWPGYNLAHNHGSVDNQHKKTLAEIGPCPVHRIKNYGEAWWMKLGVAL